MMKSEFLALNGDKQTLLQFPGSETCMNLPFQKQLTISRSWHCWQNHVTHSGVKSTSSAFLQVSRTFTNTWKTISPLVFLCIQYLLTVFTFDKIIWHDNQNIIWLVAVVRSWTVWIWRGMSSWTGIGFSQCQDRKLIFTGCKHTWHS